MAPRPQISQMARVPMNNWSWHRSSAPRAPHRALQRKHILAILPAIILLALMHASAFAAPQNSIAIHGTAKYAAGVTAFPYVNPEAPKGGRINIGVVGTYNSLNPLIYKGDSASGVREYVYESLMTRSGDEPFSLYGLIAESIDVPDDRASATFVLRPEARFSDGAPITADDVLFSHTLLKEHGWNFMRTTYSRVRNVVKVGERGIRFEFDADGDRELAMLMGLMPILPKKLTNPATFEQTSLAIPVGSGPYLVSNVDAGRSLVYMRNPNWWGKDLPIMRGRFNFDEIHVEYFRANTGLFEAFKAGEIDVIVEDDSARWARGYEFPAVTDGRIAKREFTTRMPAGMSALVFNTRQRLFSDRRVREALILVFDAEWINPGLYGNLYKRTQSFFERSELSSAGVAADAEEQRLLQPFPGAVKPAIADGSYKLPQSPGTGNNRTNQTAALKLLREAGYQLRGQRLVDVKTGIPVTFEVLITSQRQARLLLSYSRALDLIGIKMTIREVDDAQYETRLKSNEFDMVQTFWSASLSPGNEQWNRWGSASADVAGARNYAGVKSDTVDAMITAIVAATDAGQFRSAVRAFDRVLRSGDYVIPLFYSPKIWVAHWTRLKAPHVAPNSGFDLETWWSAKAEQSKAEQGKAEQ